jgi:tetratricopeptide (TPR) repeat protein
MTTRSLLRTVGWLLACAVPGLAYAYDFKPTSSEFSSWPSYCQARYVTLPIGEDSPWAANISRAQINSARLQLGANVFEYVHHYCAGMMWLRRARVERDQAKRALDLKTARIETLFTYNRLPSGTPMRAPVLINLASITEAMGDGEGAVELLEQAIEAAPDEAAAYLELGIIYRKRGQLDKAREALLRGDAAVGGESAEIHYNLGLLLIEMNDLDGAEQEARRAYALGHPLPGLKNKLLRLGRPIENSG